MAAPADENVHATLPPNHDEGLPDRSGAEAAGTESAETETAGAETAGAAGTAAPGTPITDEEYSDLGRTMGQLLHRIMRARQENDGGGTAVLAMLSKCGPVRASFLAKELFLDLSTISRHVQHLERDGLIERAPDPDDRRATTLHLTGLGEKHMDDFWQRRIDAMREGLGDWDPEEMRTLLRLLRRYAEDYSGILGRGPNSDNN